MSKMRTKVILAQGVDFQVLKDTNTLMPSVDDLPFEDSNRKIDTTFINHLNTGF